MKPIEQIALELAAKLGWVPGHDDLADEVIDNIASALRARDAEWREAVEGVAKRIDEWFRREETNMETQGEPEFSQCELMATAYRDCSNLLRELLKGEVK